MNKYVMKNNYYAIVSVETSIPKTAPRALISPRAQGIGGGRAVGPQENSPFEKKAGQGIPRSRHRGRSASRGTRG